MRKKILALLLSAFMLLTLVPVTAMAAPSRQTVKAGMPNYAITTRNMGFVLLHRVVADMVEKTIDGIIAGAIVIPAVSQATKKALKVGAVVGTTIIAGRVVCKLLKWLRPGTDNKSFKAVYNTAEEANVLTFYYDEKDHSSEGTVYDELYTAPAPSAETEEEMAACWQYDDIRESVKGVVIDASVKNYKGLTSTAYMFYNLYAAENIQGAEYLDVSNVTDMSYMFYKYGAGWTEHWWDEVATPPQITAVPNVSNWDTGKVTDMSDMFGNYGYYSEDLNAVPDVSNWQTGNVTDMNDMFDAYADGSLVLDAVPNVSNWDTGKVTDMNCMFCTYGETSEVLDAVPNVSNWNTASVTDLNNMFCCYGFASPVLNAVPNVSSWGTGEVTDMSYMFDDYGCHSEALTTVPDVSNWDTGKVTNVYGVFYEYGYASSVLSFTLNLSGWDISNVDYTDTYCYEKMFEDAGTNASEWSVTIPNDGTNTGSCWYLSNGSSYIEPLSGKSFTLIPN